MNKEELINAVWKKTNLPKTEIKKVLDAVLASIEEALSKGESVSLVGFGSFHVVARAERKGRNPRTGEEMLIPARKAVKFRMGKRLKEKLG